MKIDLSDEERFAFVELLVRAIEADRCLLSPRVRILRRMPAVAETDPLPKRRRWREHAMRCIAVAGAIILATTAGPQAAEMTTSDLREICNARDDVSKSACKFYILGVMEGTSLASGVAADKTHFCIPEGVEASQMVLLFRKAVREDIAIWPKDLQTPAVSFVGAVMNKAWPCPS